MSAPRTTLLSAGTALALALAAPGTAAAAPGSGQPEDRGASSGRGTGGEQAQGRPGRSTGSGKESRGTASSSSSSPSSSSAAKQSPAAGSGERRVQSGRPADKPGTAGQQRAGSRPAPTGKADRPAGDPRGNNGTIKIDTVPADEARANRPHPGCTFSLTFFNFDAGQHADITFTGQAPTATGTLLSLSNQLISTSPADGAMESAHTVTLSAADLGLLGTPQVAQGWHVKVAVDALEAPGGAKQKVFWLDCPQDTAPVTGEQPPAGPIDATAVSPAAVDRTATPDTSVGVLSAATTRARLLDQVGPASTPVRAAAAVRAAASQPAGASSYRASVVPFGAPDSLPFTGPAGLALALATGLAAVGGGALALSAGRRRATD